MHPAPGGAEVNLPPRGYAKSRAIPCYRSFGLQTVNVVSNGMPPHLSLPLTRSLWQSFSALIEPIICPQLVTSAHAQGCAKKEQERYKVGFFSLGHPFVPADRCEHRSISVGTEHTVLAAEGSRLLQVSDGHQISHSIFNPCLFHNYSSVQRCIQRRLTARIRSMRKMMCSATIAMFSSSQVYTISQQPRSHPTS